jgi:hypothetical protein
MQKRFVRRPRCGIRAANDFTDAARDDAERISARGHDANDEIVLDVEDLVGVQRTFVGFDPQLGRRDRVGQLHRDAQAGAGLADAAVDHVTSRLVAGAGGDDPKIAEARQAGVDLGGQTLGQSLNTGVDGTAVKRRHRHPEAVVARVRVAAGCARCLVCDVPQPGREQPCGLEATAGGLGQALVDQRDQGRRHARLGDSRRRIAEDRRRQLSVRRAAKRPMTRQHLEQDDAKRKYIGALIDLCSRDLFGRHVERRAQNHSRVRAPV